MKTLLVSLCAAALAACAVAPPPPLPHGGPSPVAAQASALAHDEVRAVLGEAAWREIAAARTAVLVRRGVSLPRMIQQPDGSWKPEGPYANAAVRTSHGWVGWPGGLRTLLAPETSRELDRLLAQPALWAEPPFPPVTCTDPGGLTSVIRVDGREHVSTHPCGEVGLTGQVAGIVMAGRIVDWTTVPVGGLPAGIPLGRLPDPAPSYFRYSSAVREPRNLVIRGQAEWDAQWARITAGHGPRPATPIIDWSREMLLMAAWGTKPTGGYTIAIDRVVETPHGLDIHVVRTAPGPRCGVTSALTSPVDIVRVPRSDKPVHWHTHDLLSDCP